MESGISKRSLVFILSADRSGSTWVGYVLGSLPRSIFVGEFRRLWDQNLRQDCAWCHTQGRSECELFFEIDQYPAQRAYDLAFDRSGAGMIVDSSKRISWAQLFIAPNPSFDVSLVHLIRDPRGWYASEAKRHPGSLKGLLSEWTRENLAIRQFIESSRVNSATVFYDELAGSPETAFADLCNKLGCQFDKQALRYWEKIHHGFAANGATSPLFASAPNKCEFLVTCDDQFYETNGRCSFVDQRWREQLTVTEQQAIREDRDAVEFLNQYDRVLTSGGLLKLSTEERSSHRYLEGKFIRSQDAGPQAE